MAANKIVTIGPVALTTTNATTLTKPGTSTGNTNVNSVPATANIYLILRKIRIVNTTAGALTASLFVGAAAAAVAGTEFLGSAISVGANSFVEWVGLLRLETGQTAAALCGGASLAGLTFEAEGEIGVA